MKTETKKRTWAPPKWKRITAHAFLEGSPHNPEECALCGREVRNPIHRWQTEDGPA